MNLEIKGDESMVIPPNEIATVEFGPKFLPILKSDYISWILVFIFYL